jgi:hypothetical protein
MKQLNLPDWDASLPTRIYHALEVLGLCHLIPSNEHVADWLVGATGL